MVDTKLTDLAADASLTGTEELYVNDAGTDKKVTANQVKAFTLDTTVTIQGDDDATVDVLKVRIGKQRAVATFDAGANAVLVYTAVADGATGNAVQIVYQHPGLPSQPLSIGVVGSVITASLATDADEVVTTTASQVKAAIEASGPVTALVTVAHGVGSNGSGLLSNGLHQLEGGLDAADALSVDELGVVRTGYLELTPQTSEGDPQPGFLLNVSQALDDNADSRFIIRKLGVDEVVFDDGGMDLLGGVGQGEVVLRFGESDGGGSANLGSRLWDMYSATAVQVFHISPAGGLILGPSTAAIGTGFQTGQDELQIKYDSTAGAPVLQIAAQDAVGAVTFKNILINGGTLVGLSGSAQTYTESNVTTDRTFNANATTLDELADIVGTLIGDLRNRGVVA